MRSAKRWFVVGLVVVVLGALPILAGLPRALVIAAGALVALLATVRLLADESDVAPGSLDSSL